MTTDLYPPQAVKQPKAASKADIQPWIDVPAKGPILRPSEAAAYYGVAISTYYMLIQRGEVPGFIKLSRQARASGVPQGWLDAAIAARATD